jgi:hypothetical protein
MKLAVSRQLEGYPADLATLADALLVLVSREGTTFLESYDAHLAPRWSKRLEATATALHTAGRKPWVFDAEGVWVCGDRGECLARVSVRPREGMRLGAFGPVGDGCIFAWQHDTGMPMRAPILERVDSDGTIRWSVALPIGLVGHEGVVQMRADEGWKPRPKDSWTPETWFTTSRTLSISGDAVLVCFSEMPRSGIGFGYVLSVTDGTLRFTTKKGPISEVAPVGEGGFLVGYQGYGAFETLRYDRDGRVLERWASHGYYLVDDCVRLIELENVVPSKMHLARLDPGGKVTRGDWLDGYYTSRPLLDANRTVYFFRKGTVLAARDLSIVERLPLASPDDGLFSTKITGGEWGFYLAYTRVAERGASLVCIEL